MFFHDVIEDNDLLIKSIPAEYEKLKAVHTRMKSTLLQAQRFHLGKYEDTLSVFANKKNQVTIDFDKIRLPYPVTYIDFYVNKKTQRQPDSLKGRPFFKYSRAAIVAVDHKKDNRISYHCLFQALKIGAKSLWANDGYIFVYDKTIKNLICCSAIDGTCAGEQGPEIFLENRQNILSVFFLSELLKCKNIITETISPPIKVNKKRLKKGKLSIYSYKVLDVKPSQSKTNRSESKTTHSNQRVNLCRGHFKTYTEDNKLFGKSTGTYWWQPHVRGDKKRGVVAKRYKVVPPHSSPEIVEKST